MLVTLLEELIPDKFGLEDVGVLNVGELIALSNGPNFCVASLFITYSPGVSIAGTVSVPRARPPDAMYLGTIPPDANFTQGGSFATAFLAAAAFLAALSAALGLTKVGVVPTFTTGVVGVEALDFEPLEPPEPAGAFDGGVEVP